MRRYIKRDDVILLAVEFEFGRMMAFVAVEDQQSVFALCPGRCMVVEVFDPIQIYCIGGPTIVGGCDVLVGREVAFSIPVGEVVLRN